MRPVALGIRPLLPALRHAPGALRLGAPATYLARLIEPEGHSPAGTLGELDPLDGLDSPVVPLPPPASALDEDEPAESDDVDAGFDPAGTDAELDERESVL